MYYRNNYVKRHFYARVLFMRIMRVGSCQDQASSRINLYRIYFFYRAIHCDETLKRINKKRIKSSERYDSHKINNVAVHVKMHR